MLDNLLSFVLYFVSASALMVLFGALYIRLTPYPELALIRSGNLAAALALVGALTGFALALASVISHSTGTLDMLVWGLVAMLVQLAVYLVVRWLLPDLAAGIDRDCRAHGAFLGGCSLCAGLLNAACMVW